MENEVAQKFICPLCWHDKKCCKKHSDNEWFTLYYCDWIKKDFYISKSIDDRKYSPEYLQRVFDIIGEKFLRQPILEKYYSDEKLHFYINEDYEQKDTDPRGYINLKNDLDHYPETLNEKIEHVLLNLSIMFPNYGDSFYIGTTGVARATYYRDDNYSNGILDILDQLDYITIFRNNQGVFTISAKGWQKIDEITKKNNEIKQGFIAMAFREETESIREAFKNAIEQCGYFARLIDEKEHNNQIVPEIFYEIGRSKFVVVDVTVPNYGAYYEAGYAQALGKQVIMCCRKVEFDSDDKKYRPHFDVAQKSMIVWETEDDLIERLKKRIEATVK